MDIKLLAAILLVGRVISVYYLVKTMRIQIRLLKENDTPELQPVRLTLFLIANAIFFGCIFPIILDVITLFTSIHTGRPTVVHLSSIIYTFSVNWSATLASYLLWRIYKDDSSDEITERYIESRDSNKKVTIEVKKEKK